MTTYTVPRVQATYSDALTALGLGRLLKVLTGGGKVTLCLDVARDVFMLDTVETVRLQDTAPAELYRYIRTEKDSAAPAESFDYDTQKSERQGFFAWRKQYPKAPLEEYGKDPPRSDYSLYSSLVDMLKPIHTSGYAAAHRELASERAREHLQIVLEAFSGEGLPAEKAEAALKKRLKGNKTNEVSIVQIFNPMTGKGMNSPKANSIGMGQEKAPLALEALKYAGWFIGAVAVTPRNSKDLKVLVVQPAEIEIDALERVMLDFRRNFIGGGAIQADILAAITLTETLLKYHEAQEPDWLYPAEVIMGFQTAYFQNLGSAKGVTNISFIALPAWVRLDGDQADEQRRAWLEVLAEHRLSIRTLDESHSEERNLLERYREFLSGQDARAFLDFLSDYGPHMMRMYERLHGKAEARWRVRWLSEEHLDRVLKSIERGEDMQKQERKLTSIIETPGFVNIAKAIRGATRNAVMAKKPMPVEGKPPRQPDRSYEIRYGLAQDLKRAAVTKEKFLAALSSFIADYNAENLRVYERRFDKAGQSHPNPQRRVDISTDDLLDVAVLLDEHDPQTVAMLLIAYGYSKTKREPKDDGEAGNDNQQHEETNAQQEASA